MKLQRTGFFWNCGRAFKILTILKILWQKINWHRIWSVDAAFHAIGLFRELCQKCLDEIPLCSKKKTLSKSFKKPCGGARRRPAIGQPSAHSQENEVNHILEVLQQPFKVVLIIARGWIFGHFQPFLEFLWPVWNFLANFTHLGPVCKMQKMASKRTIPSPPQFCTTFRHWGSQFLNANYGGSVIVKIVPSTKFEKKLRKGQKLRFYAVR